MAGGLGEAIVEMDRHHRRAAAVVIVIIILVIFISSLLSVRACYDSACFIAHANMCGVATFTNKVSTATVRYETAGCLLNKTIIDMESWEPEIVRESVVGKGMVCAFVRNDFSPLYLTRLSANLANCEGELKEELIRYQYIAGVTTLE